MELDSPMTTTGEYLVSISSLSSGTALEHLLAIQMGTGSGSVVTRIDAFLDSDPVVVVEDSSLVCAVDDDLRTTVQERDQTTVLDETLFVGGD